MQYSPFDSQEKLYIDRLNCEDIDAESNYLEVPQDNYKLSVNNYFLVVSLLICVLLLGSCSAIPDGDSGGGNPRLVEYGQPVPKGGGYYKVGSPYRIGGKLYRPKEDPNYNKVGIASWYGPKFHGRKTANGEIFDMDALTAAHPTLPMPSFVRVQNLANNKTVVLRVNDRGPYAHNRIIDLSSRAADVLDIKGEGTAKVRVTYLGRAPLNGDDGWVTTAHKAKSDLRRVAQYSGSSTTTAARLPKSAGSSQSNSTLLRPAAASSSDNFAKIRGHTVQAASLRNRTDAYSLANSLQAIGPSNVIPVQVNGSTFYRVRVGPFENESQAASAINQLNSAGLVGARMVAN